MSVIGTRSHGSPSSSQTQTPATVVGVVGTRVGGPSAFDQLVAERLDVVSLQFSRHYDETLRQKVRAAIVRQGVPAIIQIDIVTPSGLAVDLTQYGLENGMEFAAGTVGSSSSSSSETVVGTGAVAAKLREASEHETCRIDADASVFDAETGTVRVVLPASVYNAPGIYWLEVAVLDANSLPIYIFPNYLWVERSNWGTSGSPSGPPPLHMLRQTLRDSDIYENLLIEEHDFDAAELCMAATRTIQFWNEQLPRVASFSTRNMPYQDIWTEGIQLFLFQMVEEHYRRNKLAYKAGGTDADDKNKDREYKIAWQERYQTFRTRVSNIKAQLNIANGWRTYRQF